MKSIKWNLRPGFLVYLHRHERNNWPKLHVLKNLILWRLLRFLSFVWRDEPKCFNFPLTLESYNSFMSSEPIMMSKTSLQKEDLSHLLSSEVNIPDTQNIYARLHYFHNFDLESVNIKRHSMSRAFTTVLLPGRVEKSSIGFHFSYVYASSCWCNFCFKSKKNYLKFKYPEVTEPEIWKVIIWIIRSCFTN